MSVPSPPDESRNIRHPKEKPLQVLLVEDNPGDARLFEEYLGESSTEAALRHEETLQAGLRALEAFRPDVLVVDLGLPDSEGAETVKDADGAAPEVPIVVLTGQEDLQVALEALEAGATEYLQKDELGPALVGRTLQWALQQNRMQAKLRQRDAWIRSITEGLSAGVFQAGPNGQLEYANEALAEMLGFEQADELIGRDLADFYADPVQQGRVLAEEGASDVEVEFEGQGLSFVGLLSATGAYDEHGAVLHYDGTVTDITERVETKRKLRRSRDQLAWQARMLDEIGQAVIATDEEGTVTFWNAAAEETYGWAEDEALGRNTMELTVPESAREEAGRIMAAIREKESWTCEFEVRRKDGSTFPAIISNTPLVDEEGELTGVIGVTTDITDRKQREERLRMLSEAVEQAKEAVLITEAGPLDEPGPRIEYVNAACEEMTGYAEEEILGKTPRILQGPDTERDVLDSLRAALEAGEEWEGETVNYRKDGTPYRVQWNVSPVRNGDGEIEHWVCVQRDVTEEREREERLRLLAEALEQVGDKVVITDPEGQIQYVNEAFEEITGYSKEEALAKTPRLVQSGEQSEDFYGGLWETIRSGETFRADLVNERKDGTQYVEDEQISPVTDEEGQVTHFVSTGRDVTERRRRQLKLGRQNDLFKRAQEIANVGAWEYDVRKEEGTMTDQAYRIHGLAPSSDMSPEKSLGFYHAEDRPTIRQAFRQAVEKGEPYDVEVRLITEGGEERWVRTRGEPLCEDGEVVRIRGTIRDITERKRREGALERQNDLFEKAQKIAKVGAWEYDVQSGEFTLTEQGYRAHGLTPSGDFTPSRSHELFYPEDRHKADEAFRQAVEEGEPYDIEAHLTTEGGEERWVRSRGEPQREEGDVVRVRGAIQDITDRKERERELREKERQLEQIRENVRDVVWISTPDKRAMEFISDAYEEVWGRTTEELKEEPTSFIEGIHPDDRDRVRLAMKVQKKRPEAYEEIYRVVQPSGEVRWVHDRAAGAYGEDGRLERVVGVATDITEKKRRERQLIEAKEEAERMNRLKSAFLANMSHEIRTPLTSSLGFAEMIGETVERARETGEVDLSTLTEFSSLIERSGQRLMDTLTGVLNLSKLQAGEMTLELGPVDLSAEVAETVEEFGPQAKRAGLDLQVRAEDGPVWARADEGGLQIALRNLLSNAIKYTDEGGEVRVRARRAGDMAAVEVEDTGIGMDPETVSGLFEAFKQASEGMEREYEGTGLGLTVTKEVLDQMGGSIEVETEKGEGSRFTVRLPRAEDLETEDPGET